MGLFSSSDSKQSLLGVDIGYGGIKLVELRMEKGRARLVTYAYVNMAAESLDKNLLNDVPAAADLLKRMCEKARTTTKRAVAAIPMSSVFSAVVSVPTVDDKEIKDQVMAQAKKLISLPFEEVSLDQMVIDKTEKSETSKPSTRVFVTAAPKTLVNTYVEIFRQAGLSLVSLEMEAMSEIRSLVGKDRSTIMVVDIGSLRTNIMIVERGVPFVVRSIATGGVAITQTIAKTLGIPMEQAESMKRDIKAMQAFAPTGDLSPILSVLVKPILDEIRYSLNSFQAQDGKTNPPKKVDKIVLTGGSSLLPRLPEFLTQQMSINAYLGNPWARVVYPLDLRPIIDEMGSRFAVSVGCAMRDQES